MLNIFIKQLEIFWCLNNLVCVENSPIFKTIVDKNFISILPFYLNLKREDLTKQLLSCLGNIIAENTKFRDYVLEHTVLIKKLIALSKNIDNSISLIKNLIFIFRNLARGNPKAPFERVILFQNIFLTLKTLINKKQNTKFLFVYLFKSYF